MLEQYHSDEVFVCDAVGGGGSPSLDFTPNPQAQPILRLCRLIAAPDQHLLLEFSHGYSMQKRTPCGGYTMLLSSSVYWLRHATPEEMVKTAQHILLHKLPPVPWLAPTTRWVRLRQLLQAQVL